MKILEKLYILTYYELLELDFVINSSSRKSIQNLHIYLKELSKPSDYDKSHAYLSAFGKTYSVHKDYLIRNELRLYSNYLTQILSHSAIETNDEKVLYLRALLKRKAYRLLEFEIGKTEKRFLKEQAFQHLSELYSIEFNYLYQAKFKIDSESINRLNSTLLKNFHSNSNGYKTDQKFLEVANAFLSLNSKKLGFGEIESLNVNSNTRLKYFNYLSVKESTFKASGDEKIKLLDKAISLLPELPISQKDIDKEHLVLLNNLALEYYFHYNYNMAVKVFEKIIDLSKNNKQLINAPLYYNYLSALLKSGQFQSAYELIQNNMELFRNTPVLKHKFLSLQIMCYLLNGQTKDARLAIPEKLNEGSDDDYYYLRLCLAIVYYLESKLDLCERENTNLIQIAGSSSQFDSYTFCAKSFNKFLKYSNSKQLQKLNAKVESFIGNRSNRHGDILPILWLSARIKSKLSRLT